MNNNYPKSPEDIVNIMEGVHPGRDNKPGEKMAEVGPYEAYGLASIESVKRASKGTRWGLEDDRMAELYLPKGLAVIYMNGRKYAMCNGDCSTVMDVGDQPMRRASPQLQQLLDQIKTHFQGLSEPEPEPESQAPAEA
jgi:hypothetical protein